ncbi:MAG: DUF1697 domain-containing protein [Flavobacterium sp.]
MKTYLALLRGINVSGKKIIKMEALRALFEAAGFTDVKTHIQSGNVIFRDKSASKEKIAAKIEKLIEAEYGFNVTVFVLDEKQVEKAVEAMPYADNREPEGAGSKKLYVTFLSEIPSEENFDKLELAPIGDDLISLHGDVLYFKLESKASESKLSNNLIETKLKVKATTRNWNVTLKLLELLQNHN